MLGVAAPAGSRGSPRPMVGLVPVYALTDICSYGYMKCVPSTFAALADPHRRAMLALMLEQPRPVGELVERLGLTQPGTSKHLRVLREAGLVQVRRDAQRRVYALDPGPLAELDAWLEPYRGLWNARLDALERHLDRTATRED
jgi:DNA-binding transcriptional ArsR family regulator